MLIFKLALSLKIIRAVLARLLFIVHGLIALNMVVTVYKDRIFWCYLVLLLALMIEGILNITQRQGDETRWFCPSIFIYVCMATICVWHLELFLLNRRLADTGHIYDEHPVVFNKTEVTDEIRLPGGKKLTIRIAISHEVAVQLFEQTLMVVMILGRWILPRGEISSDDLSQLLMVYLGTGADIVEIFEVFKEPQVMHNVELTYVLLTIYSISLLQFPLAITAGRTRKMRAGYLRDTVCQTGDIPPLLRDVSSLNDTRKPISRWGILTDANVWGIVVGIFMLDGPFLAMRLYLMIKLSIVSYSMVFFTSKNVLIVLLQLYRLEVILFEQNVAIQKRQKLQRNVSLNLRRRSTLNESISFQTQQQLFSCEREVNTDANGIATPESESNPAVIDSAFLSIPEFN